MNIQRVMNARGITTYYKFLVKNGFTPATATKLVNGKIEYFKFDHVEKLCTLLNCTPNDLIEWTPNEKSEDKPGHPLQAIRKKGHNVNLTEILKTLPMDKLKEVEKLIQDSI